METIKNKTLQKYINNNTSSNIQTNPTNIKNKTLQKYINNNKSIQNDEKEDKSLFKTIGSTAGDLATNIGRGFLNTLEGVVDLGRYGVAGVSDLFGADNYANEVRERAKQDTTSTLLKPAEDLYNKNSALKEDGLIEGAMQGVGNATAMIGGGAFLKGANAIKIGKLSIPTTSVISGMGSGMTEAYNDGANDGQALLYGALNGSVEGALESIGGIPGQRQIIGNTTKQVFKNYAKNAIGEGVEEVASSLINPLLQTTYKGTDALKQYGTSDYWGNVAKSGIVGATTGAIMDTPNTISTMKYNKALSNQSNLNKATQNNINILNKQNVAENGLNTQITNDNSNKFTFLPTANEKSNNFKTSVSKYLNNSDNTINFVNTVDKIIKDKNYNVLMDDTITNKLGDSVNAKITTLDNGEVEIKINPNSERAGEFLLMHEVTHAIETDSMKNLILDYAGKNTEFNTALESLKQAYGTEDVSPEVVADISGQLFGNQEFISNLSIKEPNVFKKLYNKIIEIANKITGNSKESLFIKDLKNKWEEAYRTQNNNLNKTTYSIQNNADGSKYVNVDTNQDIFNGKSLSEQTKIAKQYILDTFRQNGIDVGNENISVTSRTANEYTHPKKQNSKYVASSKMKASTELDNLLNIAEYSHSDPDDGRHIIAKDGWDYYKVNFKVGNQSFEGLVNIGKNGNVKTLYDITRIKKTSRVGSDNKSLTTNVTSSYVDNIPQSINNVNTDTSSTKYSMQENQNNTQELDNSSFSLRKNNEWQEHLEKNYKSTGTKTNFSEIRLKGALPTAKQTDNITKQYSMPRTIPQDPIEISKLSQFDASTTPLLNDINRNQSNDEKSNFYSNVKNKTNMLNDNQKQLILSNDDIKYYDKITNKESLDIAFDRMNKNGKSETLNWFGKDSTHATSVDVAEGYILLKQYADNNDADGMVAVAKKMREIGTKAGQTVQAFNLMERLTPEGMVKYAQSELSEAYERMIKNKSKEWIDKHRSNFDLKPNEVQFIMDNMKAVSEMKDGYDKKVKLAEIQKLMTDKLPPEKGSGMKSWMRISMLFNPKTQVRNVAGNAIIAPVNYFGDIFSSYVDKKISKVTGIRTTGNMNVKAILDGIKKGAYESTNDYKKGINTKDMEGNKFEIGKGKSFNEKTLIGKSLNRVDSLLNYMLDVGDRVFSEASFENSLQNQMILNNTSEITQDMIDIARQESLSRTWNDNNGYTSFVLGVRRGLNKINIKGYGLGDVLIPFAKTPANLTKAIVDYSPIGFVDTLIKGYNLKNSIETGQFTSKMQHEFVQSLGKATAGSMLYVLGIALANAGITTGASDDDKDAKDFMKNTLGINSYSIKIGNKTFTYDWAQPLAAPLSITANIVNKNKTSANTLEKIISSLDTAGNILLEQSFMQSIKTALTNNDGLATGIQEAILELPSRTIPTFMKQIVDLTDSTQRTTFEYNKPLETAINKVKAKIPGLSYSLAPSVDTLGREIQRYGGKNNIFNVFINPANVNTDNISKSAKEIYKIYKETGDKTLLPRVAPYYINVNGEKIMLTAKQKSEFQKVSGKSIEDNVEKLISNKSYNSLSNEDKAKIIKDIVDYSYNYARKEVINIEMASQYQKVENMSRMGISSNDYYISKNTISEIKDKYSGNANSKERKKKVFEYINNLSLSKAQKLILFNQLGGYSIKNNRREVHSYINSLNLSKFDKCVMAKNLGYTEYDDYIIKYIMNENISRAEKEVKLTSLGFTIKNNKVYK